ncbi:MAG: aldo/keto reductase [Anaerolineaceae bacterium]|nr:aldo/keto reductase [Anaerolineaceae bacterium]
MSEESAATHPVFEQVNLAVGTWAWGDRLFWGYGKEYQEEDLRQVFRHCLASGIRFFDTAEVYGQGRSESLLGKFIQESGERVTVATKFMPYPWRLRKTALLKALRASLKRLGLQAVDLYQIHWPYPPVTVETWMDAMIEAHQEGLLRSVGVSNYDRQQMERAQNTLTRKGIQLVSNQVEYHLLNRRIERNGLLKQCQGQGITLIAYSPLAQGILSGKYTPENPPSGPRRGRYGRRMLAVIQPLIRLLNKMSADYDGKSPAQIAINWTICKGTLPIPGIKTVEQFEQDFGAQGWRLKEEDVALLDEMSDQVTGKL